MNEADTQFLGISDITDYYLSPIDSDGPAVGLVHASKYFHQRRFSGPIFADQRDHLAGRNREVDIT